MATISCPNCHKAYEVNNDVLGMNVECEACHTIFQAVDSSFSPSVRTGAMASKHHIDRKWIVVFSAIGMMMIIQTVTLIIMLSRHGAAENTPVPITGANPAQTETPSELLLKYTEQGETSYVEALLKQNPTLDVDRPRSKTGSTALYTACRLGYVDIAKVLLRRKANVNDDGQQGGFTPITAAAFSGHLSTVKLLLASGVDIESQDRRERTALYAAVEGNKLDVVRFLCESGANVNVKEKSGWTPLTRAAYNGYLDVAKALVKHGKEVDVEMQWNGDTALFLAVCENKPEMIRFLCEYGANVNVYGRFSNAWTPLTYAADNGLTEVVSILVQYGKDIDLSLETRNYPRSTPLELASKKHYDDIVKILKENIEKREKQGRLKQNVIEASEGKEEKKDEEKPTKEFSGHVVSVDDDCVIIVRDFTKSGVFFGIQRKVRLDGIKMNGGRAKQFLEDRLVRYSAEVRVTYKDRDGACVKGTVWENGGEGVRVREWDGTMTIKSLNDILVDEGYAARD